MATEQVSQTTQRPYFLWDYNLSDDQVRSILQSDDLAEKSWLVARILQYAKWDDIWRYLTIADIRQVFDRLRFRRPQDKELWGYALGRWARYG